MAYNSSADNERQQKIRDLQNRLEAISSSIRKELFQTKKQITESTDSYNNNRNPSYVYTPSSPSHTESDIQNYKKAKESSSPSTPSVEEILQDIKLKMMEKRQQEQQQEEKEQQHLHRQPETTKSSPSFSSSHDWESHRPQFVKQTRSQEVIKSREYWKCIPRDRLGHLKKKTLSRILSSKKSDKT